MVLLYQSGSRMQLLFKISCWNRPKTYVGATGSTVFIFRAGKTIYSNLKTISRLLIRFANWPINLVFFLVELTQVWRCCCCYYWVSFRIASASVAASLDLQLRKLEVSYGFLTAPRLPRVFFVYPAEQSKPPPVFVLPVHAFLFCFLRKKQQQEHQQQQLSYRP